MMAISLWQPWASLIAAGLKRVETRSWETRYRGPLAIHASARWSWEMVRLLKQPEHWGPLSEAGIMDPIEAARKPSGRMPRPLPLGCHVATCVLEECVQVGSRLWNSRRPSVSPIFYRDQVGPDEYIFGNLSEGRWAWLLRDIFALPTPLPAKGCQGLWEVDPASFGEPPTVPKMAVLQPTLF